MRSAIVPHFDFQIFPGHLVHIQKTALTLEFDARDMRQLIAMQVLDIENQGSCRTGCNRELRAIEGIEKFCFKQLAKDVFGSE